MQKHRILFTGCEATDIISLNYDTKKYNIYSTQVR